MPNKIAFIDTYYACTFPFFLMNYSRSELAKYLLEGLEIVELQMKQAKPTCIE